MLWAGGVVLWAGAVSDEFKASMIRGILPISLIVVFSGPLFFKRSEVQLKGVLCWRSNPEDGAVFASVEDTFVGRA